MRIRTLALGLGLALAGVAGAETVGVGRTGAALIHYLRDHFRPARTLGYRQARRVMFSHLDNQDGFVRLVYTGRAFRTSSIPNPNVVNTEHTWPQSKFLHSLGLESKKSDLHHLFPTYNRVNGERGNKAFAEIPDEVTRSWWRSPSAEYDVPTDEVDAYSEATDDLFEPREDHKGNVARALAYFYTVYGDSGLDDGWFLESLPMLHHWHHADPADDRERARSAGIAAVQGNENPFVIDPTAFGRAFELPQ